MAGTQGISGASALHQAPEAHARPDAARRRARWLKTLHQWHWVSSALSLVGMLLFSLTGITLNHAGLIEATPRVATRTLTLPDTLQASLAATPEAASATPTPLPAELAAWLEAELRPTLGTALSGREADWSPDEIHLSLPRPGGDAWLRIDRASGTVEAEASDRGWVAYFNDLHKGRHTGAAWAAFIDVLAGACVVFSLTGLLILKLHAAQRPTTWPVVGFGLVAPLLLALLFIH